MFAEQSGFLLALLIILMSFVIYVVLCPLFIKLLAKLSWRETLKTDNADLHAHKVGTYTSGGVLIVSVVSITSLIFGYEHSFIIVDLVISVVLFSFVGLIVITACVLGSCLGFLIFNRHPAILFMGDTGSLALGGFIAMLSLMSSSPFILALIGIVFVIEALSVIIQVSIFQYKGRRVFLRAPIHHHFEKLGWAENKIVVCFSVISACAGLLALLI